MNVRELIARLNVPAVRYEIGRGGIPELTNIDIAGALGMIQDHFARDVFCACWWPDGAIRTHQDVARDAMNRIVIEYAKREREAVAARLELNIAQCAAAAKGRITPPDREILRNCEIAVSRANGRCWKWNSVAYCRMFDAIIKEIRSPRLCWECNGRGERVTNQLKRQCEACEGTGKRPQSKKARAIELGIPEKEYLRGVGAVYDWAYSLIHDAETRAALAFAIAVSRETEPA